MTQRVGSKVLLDGVSLRIEAGERVALIGPSGAGKTTLLRLAAGGLLWPTEGRVLALGVDAASLRGRSLLRLRKRVGFLHQQDNLVPQLRVAHNVLMGRLGSWSTWKALWSLLRPQELERAHAALQRVELGDRLWALPDELSGGEQQRVAIARLLLQEPELVLADEPVSALDVRLGRDVVQQLLELSGQSRALVVSLHSLALLDLGFDRIVALRDGRVVHDGPPEAFDKARLADLYGADFDAMQELVG
ncbi:MAG: phosphonate ABC transporter ATP-binding protein [Planctomycetota bacterium]